MDWRAWVVLIGVIAIVVAIIVKLILNKIKGKTSCSCGCGGCAMREMCHSKGNSKGASSSEQEIGEVKPE